MKKVFFISIVVIGVSLFSSCFTGKVYHHPRVKVEQPADIYEPKHEDISDLSVDSSAVGVHPSEVDSNLIEKHVPVEEKSNEIRPWGPDKDANLKRVRRITDKWDDINGIFFIFFFLVVGLPCIALLITGFMFGIGGIMVGFWICWVLGLLGVMLLTFASIFAWAEGDDSAWVIVSTFLYALLFVMAIAFLLIVLI
jgi:hypothetical protein